MRNTIFLAAGILLALGIFFARDRLKRAFQIGAVLYAVVLAIRFLILGLGDRDSLLDLLTIIALFFLVWGIAWVGTKLALRARERSDRPPG